RFGEFSPSLVKTRTLLEEIQQLVRVWLNKKGGPTIVAPPEPPPEPVPAAAAPPPPPSQPVAQYTAAAAAPAPALQPAVTAAAAAPPVVASPVASVGIDPADLDDAGRRLVAVARYLRKQDKYNIAPYLILRGWRWGEIRYNGPEIDVTMLEA